MNRLMRTAAAAFAVLLLVPAAASAHAVLVETSPERGATVERAPSQVVFRFNEPVELAFGAVRVFDAGGEQVEAGEAVHPDGDGKAVAVALGDLADGSYTATYRVVSADGHPISGGFVFSVGSAGTGEAAAVADLLGDAEAGPVTDVAFGVAKAVSYAAIALAVGGVLFVLAVWLPSLRSTSGAGDTWRLASEAFAGRARLVGALTVAAGALGTALGLVLQAATAAGISAWEALDPDVLGDLLDTRFGTVWGLRLLVWLALGGLLAVAPQRKRSDLLLAGLLLGFLVVSPALAGHAGASEPRVVLLGADIVHVLAMSVWVGGIALLVLALPAATRRLERSDRSRLLGATLERFSPIALGCVVALLATGILQSLLHLEAISNLIDTAFGRAILVKVALVLGLIGLGALNRRRSLPRLRALAAGGAPPGSEGVVLRRSLRTELALFAGVLAAAAALTSYPPPDALAAGPFSTSTTLGEARLELTVDPAKTGPNEVHLYLTDRASGAQYDRFRDVELALRLPDKQIGPLAPRVDKAGPGHWVARRAAIVPRGDWRLTVSGRISEFEEHRALVEVPVE